MSVQKFQQLVSEVNGLFVQRGREVEMAALAMIARKHACFIGPPGVAKSAIVDQLVKRIAGTRYFWCQLFAETSPTDVFGNTSLRALEQEDVNRRNVVGHLPDAHVAFLDETFQARSSILIGTNSIMQEGMYMNGCERIKVPLRSLFGASNFYPDDEGLFSFWDRFLLRRRVEPLIGADDIRALVSAPEPPASPAPCLTLEEWDTAHNDAMSIPASEAALEVFMEVIAALAGLQHPVVVSDRRKRQAWNILRARAYLSGRTQVTPYDFPSLSYVLWSKPDDIQPVEELLDKYTPVEVHQVTAALDVLKARYSRMLEEAKAPNSNREVVYNMAAALIRELNEYSQNLKQYEARMLYAPDAAKAKSEADLDISKMLTGSYAHMGVPGMDNNEFLSAINKPAVSKRVPKVPAKP